MEEQNLYIVFTVNRIGRVGFYLIEANDPISARCEVVNDNLYTPDERVVDALALNIFLARSLDPSGFLYSVPTWE